MPNLQGPSHLVSSERPLPPETTERRQQSEGYGRTATNAQGDTSQVHLGQQYAATASTLSGPAAENPKSESWDGWPDGDFSRLYSWEFVLATEHLKVHWACEPTGGDTRGDAEAETWHRGKKAGRKCRGVIDCDDLSCNILIRPQTRIASRMKQLSQVCMCGAKLEHQACPVVSHLHSFKYGVHYTNGGSHNHPRPTHLLHLLNNERVRFEQLVTANPSVKPLALIVGQPSAYGPGKSAAAISPILLNADRVKSERRKVQELGGGAGAGGDDFIAKFAKLERDYPGFIKFSQFGLVTVIVMQTCYMASKLIKDQVENDAVNGIVSDGAHGYFLDPKAQLLISSVYGVDLHCWVPALMTYLNGASEEHYYFHFLVLFQSMAEECERRGVPVTDDMFANVGFFISLSFATATNALHRLSTIVKLSD